MKSKTLLLMIAFFLITTEGNCISSKAASDGAEEVLYGSEPVTSRLIAQTLEKIDVPSHPLRDPSSRNTTEAKRVIEESKKEIERKFAAPGDSLENAKKRVRDLLDLDDSTFDPNPLSFLLQEVSSQF
ncbi:MAG: hypothetical protein K2W94_08350 [Alphaproteobacteria bacterium]|nr:hypothetical protein [Alphaproteobacteria bacterium]